MYVFLFFFCTSQIGVFKNHLIIETKIGMHSVKESCLNIYVEVWHAAMPVSQPSNIVPKSFHSIYSLQFETVVSVSPDGYPVSEMLK